jgi:hypothetical protein
MISYVWGKDMKSIDLSPFKQNYFEIPLRVLKVAIQQRLSKLIRLFHSIDF